MNIEFLGGASEVGRSAIFLKDEKNILLDYGLKIDNKKAQHPMPAHNVDAYIISHAHLDHCGFSPALYMQNSPVSFGTEPTIEIANILIEDAMKIAKAEHMPQKYFKRQVSTFQRKFVALKYHETSHYAGYNLTLHDAGHIPGAAITCIEKYNTGKRAVYTGDFKLSPQTMHKGAEVVKSDILIIESTYANKNHPDRNLLIEKFVQEIKEVVDNGGTALIPSFAVGRAQELLMILEKHKLMENTYLDGMATKVTKVVMNNLKYIRNQDILEGAMKSVHVVTGQKDRTNALRGSSVVVTTAGMVEGGPIVNYIPRANRHSKIFLTGYQVEGTNGSKLLAGKPINVDNRKIHTNIPVTFYDFSAHSGKDDLYKYVKESDPETVICIHGDKENTNSFANTLKEMGYDAHSPKVGDNLKVDF